MPVCYPPSDWDDRRATEYGGVTMPVESERGVAEINGAHLYYEIAGSGHPLTLIHAGITDSRMWEAQFAVFAEHFRVLRYDVRGYGRSDMPPGPFTMRDDL